MIERMEVAYGCNFKGTLLLPPGKSSSPCIILFHAWMGKDPFIHTKAVELVETLDVAIFIADLYGEGQVVHDSLDAAALMLPLFLDRYELRKRVVLAFEAAVNQKGVNPTKMGSSGFCFGGLAAIELFRSGSPVVGTVVFHALLGNSLNGQHAKTAPIASDINGSILILNGYLDPMLPQQDVLNFQAELANARVNWQYHIYGQAQHAFTNPDAHDEKSGLVFDSEVSKSAFRAMHEFFLNTF